MVSYKSHLLGKFGVKIWWWAGCMWSKGEWSQDKKSVNLFNPWWKESVEGNVQKTSSKKAGKCTRKKQAQRSSGKVLMTNMYTKLFFFIEFCKLLCQESGQFPSPHLPICSLSWGLQIIMLSGSVNCKSFSQRTTYLSLQNTSGQNKERLGQVRSRSRIMIAGLVASSVSITDWLCDQRQVI